MKILVIGGSYFLGRVFTMNASQKHTLTLVNRGQYSMKSFHVEEFQFDRHNYNAWKQLTDHDFDVVVDFCAYQQNDIKTVIDNLKNNIKHYIYISTVDVYLRQTGKIQDENHPLENRHFQGNMGEYIYQKRLLEDELIDTCKKYNIAYTSLRPGNIYGPFNYAPRESLFIQRVIENKTLYHITNAHAKFQMVYVKDVVEAILLVIENKLYNQTFNIINDELIDYDTINFILKSIKDVKIENHTIEEALQKQYPLPYPLVKEEQELYNGQKIASFGLKYTSLKEGLKITYEAFLPVYQKKA